MTILVITTGGTIGAMPYENPKIPPKLVTVPSAGTDIVKDALAQSPFRAISTRCVSLEPRDSQLIDEPYRENILNIAKHAAEKEILLTHGTDTLLKSADYFYQKFSNDFQLKDKAFIITGSMTPLSNGPVSDGYSNLEFALTQLKNKTTARGSVYIVLSDFINHDMWLPQLYPYEPNRYEKIYTDDGRYNRLRRLPEPMPVLK